MIMQLNAQKFALAAAATTAIVYAVCVAFVFAAPDLALKVLGWVTHIVNVEKFAGGVEITAVGLVGGFAQVLIYAYVFAWLFARIYNKLIERN